MGVDIQKILSKLHIVELNEMQQHAAEAILGSDGDVVLLSPTGTGKTLAYLLPLTQLLDGSSEQVQALVITPGRELALQSDNVLKSMGCGMRSTACYGGRAAMDEHKVLREVKPHIVFGTPGRLHDHLDKENIARCRNSSRACQAFNAASCCQPQMPNRFRSSSTCRKKAR